MTPAPLNREPLHIPWVPLHIPHPPHRSPHVPIQHPPPKHGREQRAKAHREVAQARLHRVESIVVLEADGEGCENGVHAREDHPGVQEERGDVGLEEGLDRAEGVVGLLVWALDEGFRGNGAVAVAALVALLHGDFPLVVRAARSGWWRNGAIADEGAKGFRERTAEQTGGGE